MAAKKNTTMMETSRGCPFACDFCVATVKDGRTFRKRSPGHMVLELEHIAERHPHIRFINIVDDNLLLDRARVEEFCRLVIEKKLNRRFRMGMSTRTQLLVGKDPRSDETRTFIDLLVEAGFRGVFLGVETSHGERMKQYGKVKDFEDLRYAIDMLERKKLRVLASYILGFPEETPEDVKRTIEISRTLNSSGIKYNLLTPYPGTVLGEKMRRDGLLITDDYTLFDNVHQVVRFPAHNDEMHRAEGASALNDDAHQGGAASVRLEGVLKKATTGYYNRLDYFRKAPTGANRRFRWSIFFSYHCHWHYLVRAITRLRRIGRRLFLHDRDELEI
jgi:anaerobic magnesium-protoporphyrin IX monomethyl ester cyclase